MDSEPEQPTDSSPPVAPSSEPWSQAPDGTEVNDEQPSPTYQHIPDEQVHPHVPSHHERVFSMRAKRQTAHDFSYLDWGNVVEEAEVGLTEGQDVVELMLKSERIMRIFLNVIGRFPVTFKRVPPDPPDSHEFESDFTWISVQGILFVVTSSIIFCVFLMGILNLFFVGYPVTPANGTLTLTPVQTREKAAWKRGYLLFVATAMNVLNCTVCTGILIKRRHQFGTYFELWANSLHTSQLDVSQTTFLNCIKAVGVTGLLAIFVVIGALVKLATMVNGTLVLSMMSFRFLAPGMLHLDAKNGFSPSFYIFQTIGIVLTFFFYLWSRSLMVLYYVKIKELVNGIGMWNGRVYSAVLQKDHPQTKEGRTTHLLLYKDHCTLLDLLDGTNGLFEWILESYFATHAFLFIFEVVFIFFVVRLGHRLDRASQGHQDDQGAYVPTGEFFIRPYDIISVLVMFLLDQTFYFMVIVSSGEVTEEMMGGLEIARRSSMIGRKTDDELFFILSLFDSYSRFRPAQMEGAGFFTINKEVFVSLLVVVVLSVVVGMMFRPIFDWPRDRNIVGPFITALEGLPDCHYKVTSDNWKTCDI